MTKSSTEQDQNDSHPNDNVAGTCRTTAKTVRREALQQRSSKFRGVTRHRWTGRYEAHLWDKNCWNDSQKKKGRQVYLGAYDDEEAAAHAYDLAALKYWGNDTLLNFPLSSYNVEVKVMEGLSREEYIGSLRRKSSGFSRGVSKYRGVARHHHNGRWEARIGRVFGNKYLYLGTYATQEEAATAYDMAAIEYRGVNAVTNFDLSRYIKWIRPNTSSSTTTTAATTMIMDSTTTSLALASQEITENADDNIEQIEPSIVTTPTTSSAIGLFFKSSDFEEIFEKPTSFLSVDQPPLPTRPCHFPEDIQTYFECQDSGSYDGFEDVEGILGGLRHTGCLSEYDDVFAESLGFSCEDRPHQ